MSQMPLGHKNMPLPVTINARNGANVTNSSGTIPPKSAPAKTVHLNFGRRMTRSDETELSYPPQAAGSELWFTLNYHLSTLNFLSTAASDWLERMVRPPCFTSLRCGRAC